MFRKVFAHILVIAVCFAGLIITPVNADGLNGGIPAQPGNSNRSSSVLLDKNDPNGEYDISVLTENGWLDVGSLPFGRHPEEKNLDVGKYVQGNGPFQIKIKQKSGGAANIDSVLLDGAPPESVDGSTDPSRGLPLDKLSRPDLDVINVGSEGILVEFSGAGSNNELSVTARIEGNVISKMPFEFPVENTFNVITPSSGFYKYMLGSNPGSLSIDGSLDDVSGLAPFFKEFCSPDSGHPDGYTYGWVKNDSQYLYVAIDFTSDNTMDGDKDYTKVYVKIGNEIKEFKLSVPEDKWGLASFTYTDKVSYQHKIYKYKIPLSELEISGASSGNVLSLAFEAYGTSSIDMNTTAMLYDAGTGCYLQVYKQANPTAVYAQLLMPNLTDFVGDPVDIGGLLGGDNPAGPLVDGFPIEITLTYDPNDNKYMITCSNEIENETNTYDIKACFLKVKVTKDMHNNLSFTPEVSNAFEIYSGPKQIISQSTAFSSGNFFVVWDKVVSYPSTKIEGRLVGKDGIVNTETPPLMISDTQGLTPYQTHPIVAGGANGSFMVTWSEIKSGSSHSDIYAQLINSQGGISSQYIAVSSLDSHDQVEPSISFDSTDNKYLITWVDRVNASIFHIEGQMIGSSDIRINENFDISITATKKTSPKVIYDSFYNRFLVSWGDNTSNTIGNISGEYVNPDASIDGSMITNQTLQFITDFDTCFNSRSAIFSSVCKKDNAGHLFDFSPIDPFGGRKISRTTAIFNKNQEADLKAYFTRNGNDLKAVHNGYQDLPSGGYSVDDKTITFPSGDKQITKIYPKSIVTIKSNYLKSLTSNTWQRLMFSYNGSNSEYLDIFIADEKTLSFLPEMLFSHDVTVRGNTQITLDANVPAGFSAWFAPAGLTDQNSFQFCDNVTCFDGSNTINAPHAQGEYKLYTIDDNGNIEEGQYVLTVNNRQPEVTAVTNGDGYVTVWLADINTFDPEDFKDHFLINYKIGSNNNIIDPDTIDTRRLATDRILTFPVPAEVGDFDAGDNGDCIDIQGIKDIAGNLMEPVRFIFNAPDWQMTPPAIGAVRGTDTGAGYVITADIAKSSNLDEETVAVNSGAIQYSNGDNSISQVAYIKNDKKIVFNLRSAPTVGDKLIFSPDDPEDDNYIADIAGNHMEKATYVFNGSSWNPLPTVETPSAKVTAYDGGLIYVTTVDFDSINEIYLNSIEEGDNVILSGDHSWSIDAHDNYGKYFTFTCSGLTEGDILTVHDGITDSGGNHLEKDFEFQFDGVIWEKYIPEDNPGTGP